MSTQNVITHLAPGWIDSYVEQPANGSRVQGLNQGGVQCSVVWNSDSINHFDAWQQHMKIPATIRARQLARFTKGNV